MERKPGTYIEERDDLMHETRRRYALDSTGPYFLTLSFADDGSFMGKYSLDVEKADDSHYGFTSDEERSIREAIAATDGETLVDAMIRYIRDHDGEQLEAEVGSRCKTRWHYY